MATNTSNMKLRKPAASDTVNVTTDLSDNYQKIDNLALMNRAASTDAEAALVWTSGGTFKMNCAVKADRLAIARAIMPSTGTAGNWYRLYTVDMDASSAARSFYRIEFDDIRSSARTRHDITVGVYAQKSESTSLEGYNTSGAPSDSTTLILPVKLARVGNTLELWVKGIGSADWMGNVETQYGATITSYELGDAKAFGDETGPVQGGPAYGGSGTYSKVVDLSTVS